MQCCSKCNVPHDRTGRYCWACHATYMREWRKSRRELVLSPETIKAGAEALERAAQDLTQDPRETAVQVFAAMLGPRAKQRKVA